MQVRRIPTCNEAFDISRDMSPVNHVGGARKETMVYWPCFRRASEGASEHAVEVAVQDAKQKKGSTCRGCMQTCHYHKWPEESVWPTSTAKKAVGRNAVERWLGWAWFQSTKVYSGNTKVDFQSTKVYSGNTKVDFRSTKVYSRSTKIHFQITQSILSK